MTIQELFEKIKGLFEPFILQTRALSMGDIYGKVYEAAQRVYPMAYLHDLYGDNSGSLFALLSQEGRLYQTPIAISDNSVELGEWVEVVQEFRPIAERTHTQIIRQADGRARWFSVSATAVLNRVGEIDSKQLFDSFVAHATETGNYPYRTFYHKGQQFKTGQADFLARDGNCYLTSGLYDDSEIARAEQDAIEREPAYWGESIGYLPTSKPQLIDISGVKIPVYRSGIHLEISTLPEREAANLFTVIRQEVNRMMTANELAALIKLFGSEEKARKWLEENVEETNRAIEQAGMVTRGQEQPETPHSFEVDDDLLGEIVKRAVMSESFTTLKKHQSEIVLAIEVLNETAQQLEAQIITLQKDVTERLAKLERGKAQERQEWASDLPARANITRVVLKSRFEEPGEQMPETSTDKANATLSNLPTWG